MATTDDTGGRDLIVIGGSAGSLAVIQQVIRAMPADLPAAILIVVHQAQSTPGALPWLLTEKGALPAAHAVDGEPIVRGRVYVAQPDRHLIVERPGRMRLSLGPKENRFRPAIDPLFRTAAKAYGPRVVGVLLSGLLDDGTLGLLRVKQHGGVTVVQDPKFAVAPDMPASAARYVPVDHLLKPEQIGEVLVRLATEPRPPDVADGASVMSAANPEEDRTAQGGAGPSSAPPDTARRGDDALTTGGILGPPSAMTCPACGGAIWERQDGQIVHFRCHVGHTYTVESFREAHESEVEQALWTALRILQENTALHLRMAEKADEGGHAKTAGNYRERARESESRARTVRRVLLGESDAGAAA